MLDLIQEKQTSDSPTYAKDHEEEISNIINDIPVIDLNEDYGSNSVICGQFGNVYIYHGRVNPLLAERISKLVDMYERFNMNRHNYDCDDEQLFKDLFSVYNDQGIKYYKNENGEVGPKAFYTPRLYNEVHANYANLFVQTFYGLIYSLKTSNDFKFTEKGKLMMQDIFQNFDLFEQNAWDLRITI